MTDTATTIDQEDPGESTLFGLRTATGDLPRAVIWFRAVTIVVATLWLVWGLIEKTPIAWGPLWLFAVALLVTEYFLSLHVGPSSRLHLGFTFLILYFQSVGGMAAASMYAVVKASEWVIARYLEKDPRPLFSGAFEVALHAVAVLAATLLTELLLGFPMMSFSSGLRPVATMSIFAGAFLLSHTALMSVAVYARYGFSDLRTQLWPTTMLWTGISLFVSVPFALVAWYLTQSLDAVRAVAVIFALVAVVSAIARLNATLRRTNQALRVVNEIGNAVNSTLSRQELRAIVARETQSLFQWDRFYFATLDESSSSLEVTFLDGEGHELSTVQAPLDVGLTSRAISTREIVHYERETRQPDPNVSELEQVHASPPRSVLIAPLNWGDESLGAIGFQSKSRDAFGPQEFRLAEMVADQTAIALRNSQLFESEERANKERDEFLGIVTHEIKSPLTSIGGYSDLAKDAIEAGDSTGAIESLQVVKDESRKILRLVEDLLDASKMDGGQFSVELGVTDLTDIVRRSIDRFGKTTTHVLTLNVESEIPPIQGDEQRLEQVVANLLSNAIKYSPEGRPVVSTLRKTNECVELLVSDQGDGIPDELLPHVFDRFYRVRESGIETPKGTGLGLYITRQIVRMHGGRIDVESRVGVGTTFLVSLPLDPATEVEHR